jgi:hypothetical protein
MIAEITYKEVLTLARQLEIPDQLRLMQALLSGVRSEVGRETPQHSILELKGVGREIWQGIDVERYIQEERASWDG